MGVIDMGIVLLISGAVLSVAMFWVIIVAISNQKSFFIQSGTALVAILVIVAYLTFVADMFIYMNTTLVTHRRHSGLKQLVECEIQDEGKVSNLLYEEVLKHNKNVLFVQKRIKIYSPIRRKLAERLEQIEFDIKTGDNNG